MWGGNRYVKKFDGLMSDLYSAMRSCDYEVAVAYDSAWAFSSCIPDMIVRTSCHAIERAGWFERVQYLELGSGIFSVLKPTNVQAHNGECVTRLYGLNVRCINQVLQYS